MKIEPGTRILAIGGTYSLSLDNGTDHTGTEIAGLISRDKVGHCDACDCGGK